MFNNMYSLLFAILNMIIGIIYSNYITEYVQKNKRNLQLLNLTTPHKKTLINNYLLTNKVLQLCHLIILLLFDGLIQIPYLLAIIIHLFQTVYQSSQILQIKIDRYYLRFVSFFTFSLTLLQVILRIKYFQSIFTNLPAIIFGNIHQDLLLSFYSNIFMLLVFILLTIQIKNINLLYYNFRLKEDDFTQLGSSNTSLSLNDS